MSLEHSTARQDGGASLLSEWADRQQLADELGVHVATVIRMDSRGEGPPRQKLGNRILYHRPSVAEWLRERAEKQARA